MGGRSVRPRPRWRPVRIVSVNVRSVHLPSPVSLSGVKLAVKLTPQGPDHAVLVAATLTSHGPSGSVGALDPISWNQTVQVAKGAGIIKLDPSTSAYDTSIVAEALSGITDDAKGADFVKGTVEVTAGGN